MKVSNRDLLRSSKSKIQDSNKLRSGLGLEGAWSLGYFACRDVRVVMWIRIRIILASRIQINDVDPDSKNLVKILGNSYKNRKKSSEYFIFENRNDIFV